MKKEIISKFKERPKTKTVWWAMGLGLSTIFIFPVLGIFATVIRPLIAKATSGNVGVPTGFLSGVLGLVLSISAIVVGIKAYRKGERSWVLWVGFVPALLIGTFWVFMFVGELLFPH